MGRWAVRAKQTCSNELQESSSMALPFGGDSADRASFRVDGERANAYGVSQNEMDRRPTAAQAF